MIDTLLILAFLTYGLAILIADAKIFGCSAKAYVEDPFDEYIATAGILKIRQWFLKYTFFQKLLTCYFCMGVWCGMLAHGLLLVATKQNSVILDSYLLINSNSSNFDVYGFILAAILGAPLCYIIDLFVSVLESQIEHYAQRRDS